MSVAVKIGRNIKRERLAAGFTQEQIAKKLGLRYQSISQWERGARTPKISSVIRLADAIGVHPMKLLSLTEEKDA